MALPHGEEDRMSIDLPQASDWILLEGDEMLLIPKEKKVMHMEQICPAGECKDIPPYHELTVQVGYDSTFAAKVPNIEEWISKVLAHTQAHFYHPSLLAQIRLKVRVFTFLKSKQFSRGFIGRSLEPQNRSRIKFGERPPTT